MSSDAWPSPDAPPSPLPRIEDMPIAEQGYDQEAVRRAFDSFYRHAAQLDASLRALEAVEVFRRDADALRNDLRALRALGLGGGGPEPAWATTTYESAPRGEVPAVVLRLLAEAVLLIAVAVIAGVAHFQTWVIVVLMASAFAVIAVSEWLASRARFVPPAVAFLPPLEEEGEPAPYVETSPWAAGPAALEPAEDTEADEGALTVIEPLPDVDLDAVEDVEVEDVQDEDPVESDDHTDEAEEAAADPWEHADVEEEAEAGDEAEADDEPDAELVERGGRFRRRRR
jgi:hypothetical protein